MEKEQFVSEVQYEAARATAQGFGKLHKIKSTRKKNWAVFP